VNRIHLLKEDITKLYVDAIVNAANSSLLGGGGVDGAIHRIAGPMLLEECKKMNGCATGEAKITKGYLLPAKYVIHTVGPVWRGGHSQEEMLLASCYIKSLQLALHYKLNTIAFPNISTGVYRFPKMLASEIAIAEVNKFLETHYQIEKVIFVTFDEENHQIYQNKLNQ